MMKENMESFYSKKTILITGCTGFLGKVMLEKLLYEVPSVEKVMLFVRAKKGEQPQDRVNKTIIQSRIFDRIRAIRPDFDTWILTKLVTIEGDLLAQKLGLQKKEIERLREEVEIVIHCAASLDFNEPFDQAFQHNVESTLDLFEMSKTFKKLVVFTHISTAYVGCNSHKRSKESQVMLRDSPADIERIVESWRRMAPHELRQIGNSVLKRNNYPNTYTYTKSLTEHLLVKTREHIPLVIMRPTIIGGSWKEPVEGWTDSSIAAGALFLASGVGFLKFFPCREDLVGDQVPVDIVSNATLIFTYQNAKQDRVTFCNVGSSARNPVTWGGVKAAVVPYWHRFPPEKAIAKAQFRGIPNMPMYYLQHWTRYQLPIEAYNLYARFISKDPNTKKKAEMMKKISLQQSKKVKILYPFTTQEWYFEDGNIQTATKALSKEDQEKYPCDITAVDWDKYFRAMCWGLATFVLKEKNRPHPSTLNIDWDASTPSQNGVYSKL
eukprot:TRINITY_DN2026_c0_g1_i1.p1 TRINITY_DN2026_c0_g1~~TRINITY_DN2026_c0_g1_i1.p1  ORF type:complete len:494 (-),score=126.94 TRINITY_DN2026_c0_g1_i1:36-1517(-)